MLKRAHRVAASILIAAVLAVSTPACALIGSVGASDTGPPDALPTPPATARSFETPTPPPEPTIDPHPAKPTGGSISNGLPPTAAEVEQWMREAPGEFPRLDKVIQKTTTLDTITPVTSSSIPYGYAPTDLVILVTGVGTFVPQFGSGTTYTWGTIIIDATNGEVLGSFAAPGDPPAAVLPD